LYPLALRALPPAGGEKITFYRILNRPMGFSSPSGGSAQRAVGVFLPGIKLFNIFSQFLLFSAIVFIFVSY
jgi:hypothetical protein